jgi:hypothetical protein
MFTNNETSKYQSQATAAAVQKNEKKVKKKYMKLMFANVYVIKCLKLIFLFSNIF